MHDPAFHAVRAAAPPPRADSPGGRRLLALARRLVGHVLEEDGDVFARWRARLIASALLAAVTLGIVPFAITMRVLIVEGRGWLVVLHLLANGELWWLLLSRWPSNRLRSILLVVACFTVGFLSILTMGFASAALVWLFASILFSSLLLGVGYTLATAGSAVLLLLGVGLAIETGHAPWIVGQPAIASRWLMVTLNFTFVSLVCALGNAIVLQVLAQEEQRRQALERRLAEARQHESLGTLASGIAHDFNNLLVPIAHGLEELRSRPALDQASRTLLDDAIGSAAVARDLVQRILGFARQSAKERAVLAVAPVVQAVSGRVAARHGVRPVVTVAAEACVTATTVELHQVVDNLLDNAARATADGGEVRVDVTCERRGDAAWVRLLVHDTGPGMSPDTVARIFEPYFSTRTVGQGTGLGLPIVRSIVTGLGGEIHVRSAPGQGTTFDVRLPAASPPAEEPVAGAAAGIEGARHITRADTPSPEVASLTDSSSDAVSSDAPAAAPTRRRVLLVDDELLVRRAIERQLARLGLDVITCVDVDGAEQTLAAGPVDVVLTDWRMPGRDGFALARVLAQRAPMTPVIIMSGDATSAQAHRDWPRGVIPLQKPFTQADLQRALDAAARAQRGSSLV